MWLYLAGAVLLELNVLSFAAHQRLSLGHLSTAVAVSAALLTWFVVDYLTFEHVHLYTYDLFAERVGFKLGWGCLVFYPYFYCVGLWARAGEGDPHAPWWLLALAVAVFLSGWALSRGANLQKHAFKRDPSARALGVLEPRAVSDGVHTLLCSGFWGVSRHVNYLGEILMAVGITLALGAPADPIPWLYPSTTSACSSRARSMTTAAARPSTARCGTSTALGCPTGSCRACTERTAAFAPL